MTTSGDDLNIVQGRLQDASILGNDGDIWKRAELLDYYIAGYTQILAMTHATRRFTTMEVPPRYTATGTQNWMARYADGGSFLQWAHETVGGWSVSSLWQLEVLEATGSVPTASQDNMSQQWMRNFKPSTDVHFRFALPRDNERIIKIWYNNELLIPMATRRLDDLRTNWYSLEGEPLIWTLGTGRNRTFEIFSIVTKTTDAYEALDDETRERNPVHGIARRLTGSRTYSSVIEGESGATLPFGIIRRVTSPDRQYYARTDSPRRNPIGKAYKWGSSSGALLVLDAQVPDRGTLTEDDEPVLLPRQMQKYLRYYVLARAFNRQGEGYNPNLASFYQQRFSRGIAFLNSLHQLSRRDSRTAKDTQTRTGRRPRRVQLPADYPRVRI